MTGLSVCKTLEELLPDREIRLKWPNDVHLSGRKVCGVLIESGPQKSDLLVLGIGVNVNNSFAAAPEEIRSLGTSVYDETGKPTDLTDLLIRLLRQLEAHLTRLSAGDTRLVAAWKSRCALSGRIVEVDVGTRKSTGFCREIDEDGALVLLTEGGPVRLHGGVVTQIW